MTIAEIKSRIHNKIDSLDDVVILQHYYDLIENEATDMDFWNNLSEEKGSDIELAYREAENDEWEITQEEVMKKVSEWVSK